MTRWLCPYNSDSKTVQKTLPGDGGGEGAAGGGGM